MAATSDLTRRNSTTLWAIEELLADIHDRASDWNMRPEAERADLFLEWEGLVDRLSGVIQDDASGALTSGQRDRLHNLARHLSDSCDVIERLGLIFPDLGRLARAS